MLEEVAPVVRVFWVKRWEGRERRERRWERTSGVREEVRVSSWLFVELSEERVSAWR